MRPRGVGAKKIDARLGSRHNRRFLPSGQVAERLNAPDSKSGSRVSRDEGSNPSLSAFIGPLGPFFVIQDPLTGIRHGLNCPLRRVSLDKREILPPFGALFFFLTGESHAKSTVHNASCGGPLLARLELIGRVHHIRADANDLGQRGRRT